MIDEKECPDVRLFTNFGSDFDTSALATIWVSVDGYVFLACGPCRSCTPLQFIGDVLQCSGCKRIISKEQAKKEVLIVLKQVAALFGLFCVPTNIAVVETEETKQTD